MDDLQGFSPRDLQAEPHALLLLQLPIGKHHAYPLLGQLLKRHFQVDHLLLDGEASQQRVLDRVLLADLLVEGEQDLVEVLRVLLVHHGGLPVLLLHLVLLQPHLQVGHVLGVLEVEVAPHLTLKLADGFLEAARVDHVAAQPPQGPRPVAQRPHRVEVEHGALVACHAPQAVVPAVAHRAARPLELPTHQPRD